MSGNSAFWLANPGSDFYNGVATQSLRLNDNSSEYLGRTPSSAGNTNTFTYSCWAKISTNESAYNWVFASAGTGASNFTLLYLDGSSRRLAWYWYNGSTDYGKHYSAYLRDTTHFFHVVYAFDTTQATASDRVKVYVNGDQYSTIISDYGWMGQNENMHFNATNEHLIGKYIGNVSVADGYMSDIHMVDGQALTPDSFGETKNGVWIPKAYEGSYGTNGFRLEFKNTTVGGTSPSSSTIGADTSGNNHHFNDYNLGTNDSNLPDCPENNFMTFNALHYADSTNPNTSDNLQYGALYFHADSDDGIFATMEIPTSGKWYFEIVLAHVSKPTGVYLMGNAHENRDDFTHTSNYTSFFEGFSIQGSTNKVFEYGGSHIGSTHSSGTIYAFLIDVDNSTYDIYQNDTKILDAGTFNHPGFQEGVVLAVGNNSDSGTNNCNFYLNAGADSTFSGQKTSGSAEAQDPNGVGDFYYTTKGGLALCTKNLPDTTVSPNQPQQASDFFKVLTYEGDGNNNRDITGIGFKPDITWIKETNSTSHWAYVDSSRGYENFNSFSDNIADSTGVTNNNSTRTNDSFQVTNSGATNQNGVNYISYHWKVNGGTEVTNNEGTVTSQVQANADLGISIIRYTGTGTDPSGGGVTLGHGLTKAPELVHHKNRVSTTAGNNYGTWWSKFHAGTNMSFSAFDSNNTGGWNGSPIDEDVVTPPIANYGNVNGDTYFMYCWHSVEGFSKIGTYEGNGNTGDNQFVYTGFKPAFLLIKNIDSGHSWTLRDTLHSHYYSSDIGNPVNIGMRFKAEVNTGGTAFMIDFLSNGFKLRGADLDVGGTNTYIYLAMASDENFKFGNAR